MVLTHQMKSNCAGATGAAQQIALANIDMRRRRGGARPPHAPPPGRCRRPCPEGLTSSSSQGSASPVPQPASSIRIPGLKPKLAIRPAQLRLGEGIELMQFARVVARRRIAQQARETRTPAGRYPAAAACRDGDRYCGSWRSNSCQRRSSASCTRMLGAMAAHRPSEALSGRATGFCTAR